MKIGILTYHRAHNYGAILQAIAMRIVLQRMGHDVSYIDYWPKYHRNAYKFFSWNRFRRQKLGYLRQRLFFFNEIRSRIEHFERDIRLYIAPYCISYSKKTMYDVVVYGSDQIWRRQFATKHLNPVYFAQNSIRANRHITYAASMGVLLNDVQDKQMIAQWLKSFDKISVREKDLQAYVSLLGYDSDLVLDPTLLLSKEDWDDILKPVPIRKPGYVLYYSLNSDSFSVKAIKDFTMMKGLRFVEVKGSAGKDSESSISQCGPREFVSLIKYADYVFTTSYHGLIFSMIYEKEFYASFAKNGSRAESILSLVDLRYRLIKPLADAILEYQKIDYVHVRNALLNVKKESYKYFEKNL